MYLFWCMHESVGVDRTEELLDKLVVLKFNGALGTNMGFHGPKYALILNDQNSFVFSLIAFVG